MAINLAFPRMSTDLVGYGIFFDSDVDKQSNTYDLPINRLDLLSEPANISDLDNSLQIVIVGKGPNHIKNENYQVKTQQAQPYDISVFIYGTFSSEYATSSAMWYVTSCTDAGRNYDTSTKHGSINKSIYGYKGLFNDNGALKWKVPMPYGYDTTGYEYRYLIFQDGIDEDNRDGFRWSVKDDKLTNFKYAITNKLGNNNRSIAQGACSKVMCEKGEWWQRQEEGFVFRQSNRIWYCADICLSYVWLDGHAANKRTMSLPIKYEIDTDYKDSVIVFKSYYRDQIYVYWPGFIRDFFSKRFILVSASEIQSFHTAAGLVTYQYTKGKSSMFKLEDNRVAFSVTDSTTAMYRDFPLGRGVAYICRWPEGD